MDSIVTSNKAACWTPPRRTADLRHRLYTGNGLALSQIIKPIWQQSTSIPACMLQITHYDVYISAGIWPWRWEMLSLFSYTQISSILDEDKRGWLTGLADSRTAKLPVPELQQGECQYGPVYLVDDTWSPTQCLSRCEGNQRAV